MDYTSSLGGSDNIDWNTDDDLEIENYSLSSSSNFTPTGGESIAARSGSNEASSSAGLSNSTVINHFVGMGFNETMVIKAIENNGEENSDAILESLLTYSVLESPPQLQQQPDDSDHCSEYDESFLDDLSDAENWPENEEMTNPLSDKEKKLMSLAEMGFPVEEASIAMDRCDPDTSIEELANFICAAQISRETDVHLRVDHDEKPTRNQLFTAYGTSKKRKHLNDLKKNRQFEKRLTAEDEQMICLPRPMIGFGVPSETPHVVHRTIPEEAMGPPYFYYENVALAPKGVWSTISRFLYEIEPEFVDSKYFCANARKRGYVHNLPIHDRFPLLPPPPDTIHKALPLTKKWWPKWDTRTKLNCIQTVHGSARLTDRIRKALEEWNDEDEPPLSVQKYVLHECRKWNLVWVGKNKVAPLEADEVEMLLGFPRNHTRGISRTDRFKSLGNSFQVDTVAYHLSVLKDMFPRGINMLSLFSGIGGAEVALHRLGVPLKNVVSVEKSEVNRNLVRSWWEQTNQRGTLIDLDDVQQLDERTLESMIKSFGGFDLIVGGSPCNNLAGSNRVSRDGLEGKESALFYHYFRILDSVKRIMSRHR